MLAPAALCGWLVQSDCELVLQYVEYKLVWILVNELERSEAVLNF